MYRPVKTWFSEHPSFAGSISILCGALGFSAKAIFVKFAYMDPVDPITFLTLRMAFSFPFFAGIWVWTEKTAMTPAALTRNERIAVILLGSIGYYLSSYFDFLGLRSISASLERLILFIYPTFVVILSALFLKTPFDFKTARAIILCYGGVVLAVSTDYTSSRNPSFAGGAYVLASALTYAIYLFGSGEMIKRIGPARFTSIAMMVSSIAVLIHFFVSHSPSGLILSGRTYAIAAGVAIFSTVLPTYLFSIGIERIGANRSSLIASSGPVMTLFLARIFLNERLTALQFGGTAMVLAGVLQVSGVSLRALRSSLRLTVPRKPVVDWMNRRRRD